MPKINSEQFLPISHLEPNSFAIRIQSSNFGAGGLYRLQVLVYKLQLHLVQVQDTFGVTHRAGGWPWRDANTWP